MTTKTRYFVIASLLVLGVGLGTGLVAYYVGFPAGARFPPGGPKSSNIASRRHGHRLRERPGRDGARAASEARRPADAGERSARAPEPDRHQHRNRHRPRRRVPRRRRVGAVNARGRHGARPRDVRRSEDRSADARARRARRGLQNEAAHRRRGAEASPTDGSRSRCRSSSLGPWRSAPPKVVQTAIDLHKAGNNPQAGLESVTGNDELMALVLASTPATRGRWAGSTRSRRRRTCPTTPPTGFRPSPVLSVSAPHQRGLRGWSAPKRATTRPRTTCATSSAGSWARRSCRAGRIQEIQTMMQSLELGGTGKTAALSRRSPPQPRDVVGGALGQRAPPE